MAQRAGGQTKGPWFNIGRRPPDLSATQFTPGRYFERHAMSFTDFVTHAWDDHATDPAAVAQRLATEGVALVNDAAHVAPLAHLMHHVFGEHLGRWAAGLAALQLLAARPACVVGSAQAQAVSRCQASLALCAGQPDTRGQMSPSDAIRVTALAAAALAEQQTPRAMQLLHDALAQADATQLPAEDAAHRALAVAGNNLACTLEEKSGRSTDEVALMILAAQTGRRFWAVAGGWLETERAEYRLAMTWLQAGDLAQARQHAQACLDIVQREAAPALERFFAREALAIVARAANAADAVDAVAQARAAFVALDEDDRGWCQSSMNRLAA